MAKWSRYNTIVSAEQGGSLLFNARTGSLLRLDGERTRQLTGPFERIPEELVEFLLAQGFLVGDDVNEVKLIADFNSQARQEQRVFSATIELTEACNFRCLYCYQSHVPQHLYDSAADRILRYLSKKMLKVKHLHVNWFGGEPLLRLNALASMSEKLREQARRTGCSFTQFITTNGYLLTPAIARRLAGLDIENVQITLDGDQQSHDRLRVLASGKGTYERVLAACQNVVMTEMELMVRINVNRWNARRIDQLMSDLVARGISPANTIIHAVRMIDHGNCGSVLSDIAQTNEEFANEWMRILSVISEYGFGLPTLEPRAYNCSFDLRQTVMIGRDGTIRHCSSSDGRLATLDADGEETELTPLYDTIKKRTPFDDPECRDCQYLPMCMGGCSYLRELGREKCNPERYVLPELVRLTARQAN